MKYALGLGVIGLSVLALSGCASTPTSAPAAPAPAPVVAEAPAPAPEAAAEEAEPETPTQTAAEKWAEEKMRAEAAAATAARSSDSTAGDPLAIGDALESASTTKVEITPARQVRVKSVRDLEDGRRIAEGSATYDEALKKLGVRLGKPTWIENGKKYVWVARDASHCYRLVLEASGAVETETFEANETRMISAFSQQNVCTGVVVNKH